ncbi:LysE family translocator [Jannaschia sp. CCS1]|uniref:LysE family translocator n=1 Tax=Jannaschia sp. (strain CCS1) TaxID=290400 RepID=UPI000053B698|nr:LysE family translocator [Jannaschia sp. CCS1]ABD56017.1 Lysine exporter protein (LYSE/YGGA) [Jannaschia sp. CCS1]
MFEVSLPFIAYVVALGVAAAIPGPGVAALVGRSLAQGARTSLPFIIGLALGDVVFLTIAILGLATLANTAAGLFLVVKIMGALYLLYLGWRFWTAEIARIDLAGRPPIGSWSGAVAGLAVTLGNPKTVVFYLALVPNVIDLEQVGLSSWPILSVLTILVLLAVLIPYAALADRLRQFFASSRARRRLNRGAAMAIGGAGIAILSDAAIELRR